MSFSTEIYPLRSNRALFAAKLLEKVDREFTHVDWVDVAHAGTSANPHYTIEKAQVPGVGSQRVIYPQKRCRFRTTGWFGGKKWECDFSVTLIDKKTIKGLLRAWSRQISDRYLDRRRVSELASSRRFRNADEAFALIRQNAPAGGVMFLMNELEKWNSPPLFGPQLNPNFDYNGYYSQLLKFDIECCGGLITELHRMIDVLNQGMGSTVSPVWNAACRWIHENRNSGIYKEFSG